jgi:hypothetical protein
MTNTGAGSLVDKDVGDGEGDEEWSGGQPPDRHEDRGEGTTRVTAFLPTEVWARVGAYATAHRTTKTAALRRAISLLWFLHRRPGAQLLCEYPDGRIERLCFLDEADHQATSPSELASTRGGRRRRRPAAESASPEVTST